MALCYIEDLRKSLNNFLLQKKVIPVISNMRKRIHAEVISRKMELLWCFEFFFNNVYHFFYKNRNNTIRPTEISDKL